MSVPSHAYTYTYYYLYVYMGKYTWITLYKYFFSLIAFYTYTHLATGGSISLKGTLKG